MLIHSKLQVAMPLEGGPWALAFCPLGFGTLQQGSDGGLPVDDVLQSALVLDEGGTEHVQNMVSKAVTPFHTYVAASGCRSLC